MRAGALRARAIDYFVEPAAPGREAADPPSPLRSADVRALRPAPATSRAGATRLPLRAAVLGSPADAPTVAGALAGALRAAGHAPAAAVAVWAPGAGADPRRGPATPAAARLAARLSARGLAAAARGRLAWAALDDHPVAAAVAARRLAGALEVPLVTVLAGPRCEIVEGLLAEQDLVLVVTADPEGPLGRLAIASCTGAAVACGPCGAAAARWLALAGLAGGRFLAGPVVGLVHDLAAPPPLPLEELAW